MSVLLTTVTAYCACTCPERGLQAPRVRVWGVAQHRGPERLCTSSQATQLDASHPASGAEPSPAPLTLRLPFKGGAGWSLSCRVTGELPGLCPLLLTLTSALGKPC